MRRLLLLICAIVVLAVGLGVYEWVPGGLGAFTGDALYAVLVFLLVSLIAPRAPLLLTAGAALTFCWGIELLQLTGVSAVLSRAVPGAYLVLGSTFQTIDLLAYAVGVGAAAGVDALSRRAAGSSRGGRTTPSGGAPAPHRPAGTPSRSPGADDGR